MFLITSRELLGDSNNKALNIVFYSTWLKFCPNPNILEKKNDSLKLLLTSPAWTSVSAAVLFILLCTVATLQCILRRQQRQYVQSNPRSLPVIILHITTHSEAFLHEKTNHDDNDDTIASSIQVPKHTSFPNESGCPFEFPDSTPSSLEKASDDDISNRMIPPPVYLTSHYSKTLFTVGPTISRPVPSYTPAG